MSDRSRGFRRDERGQTVQDFAIGTSIFLLTVAFAFAFVPSIFTPFGSELPPGADAQADRVGTSIVQDLSIENRSNWLVRDDTEDFFDPSVSPVTDDTALQNRYRLPLGSSVNVSLVPIDGGPPITSGGVTLSIGNDASDRPTATVTRVVAIEGVDECDPAEGSGCKMIIRVW